MGFGADLLKNVVTMPENCLNRNPHVTSKIGKLYFRFVSQTTGDEATTFSD